MSTTPPTIGDLVYLNPLERGINLEAYVDNFLNLQSAEPSLGLPPGYSTTNPVSTYFFPIFANVNSYNDSRKYTGYNSMFFNNNTLFTNSLSTNNLSAIGDSVFGGKLKIGNDVTIYGKISSSGTATFLNTVYTTTTALSVINNQTGTVLYVQSNAPGSTPLADFKAYGGIDALYVGNNGIFSTLPKIGVNTNTPNVELTVNGSISSNNLIYDSNGNSQNWTSSYTTLCALSGVWNNYPTIFSKLSTQAYKLITPSNSIQSVEGGNTASGAYSVIVGGKNNNDQALPNVFILGSNINAVSANFTYVENLSTSGLLYDSTNNSSQWDTTFTTVCANSASWSVGGAAYNNSTFAKLSSQAFILVNPYTTASIQPVYGFNNSSGQNSSILGGNGNIASGQNSVVVGGASNNDGGQPNVFLLGSNIIASVPNFTYVNNLTSKNLIYDSVGNSSQWTSVYATVCANSSVGWNATSLIPYISSNYSKLSTQAFYYNQTNSSIAPVRGNNIATGTYGAILGGFNNKTTQFNSFIIGSNLTADKAGFTYVNNLSTNGLLYDLSGNSAQWNSVYSTVSANSGIWSSVGRLDSIYAKLSSQAYTLVYPNSSIKPLAGNNTASGYYSVIVGGSNNNDNNLDNVFILGSNLAASYTDYTYVNNISSQGLVLDGFGDSSQWNSCYSTVCSNSANWSSLLTQGGNLFAALSSQAYTLVYPNSSIIPTFGNNSATGKYSLIAGGTNNINSFDSSFVLGSNITAVSANYTFVENLSSTGNIKAAGYVAGSTPVNLGVNNTNYTLQIADNGGVIPFNNNVDAYVYVDPNIPYPTGYQATVIQVNTGKAIFQGKGSLFGYINQANNQLKTRSLWSAATIFYTGTNWVVFGDMSS
jgi:hypothetical protein